MANFFEIKISVKNTEGWNEWAKNMRSTIKAAGIPVRWQMFHYHMTLLFLDDDNCVEDMNQEFEQCMSVFYSLLITIDKLDAFTTGDGARMLCTRATCACGSCIAGWRNGCMSVSRRCSVWRRRSCS